MNKVHVDLNLPSTVVLDSNKLDGRVLKIEDPCIVPRSLDQVTGVLITSPSFVIDSPVSEVQRDTSIGGVTL